MTDWQLYEHGRSIGKKSSDGGVIKRDEELPQGARITLKQGQDYISISCSILGRINHTRFFNRMSDAEREYELMKPELSKIVKVISASRATDVRGWEAISIFVSRFQ